jgi:O-antigen/teichoic acid export membrane protein
MGLYEVAPLFPVAALSILLGGSSAQFDAHLRKKMCFKEVARVTIVSGVVGLLAAIGLVTVWRLGPAGLVWGFVAEMGTRSLLLWRQANKHGILPAFEFSFEEVKAFLSFGACEGGGILADILNTRLDQILISYFLGFYALGLYNLASNITLTFASRINSVISTVAFPVFSMVQDDTGKMRQGYIRVIKVIAFVNVPLFAGLAILAPDVVPTLFGKAWTDSVPIVQLLAIVALSRSFIGPAMSAIVAKGFARWSLYWNGGILIVMPGLIALSATTQKLSWVAGTLACFYLILIYLSYRFLVQPFWGNCGKEVLLAIGKPALLTGAAVLGIGALRLSFEHINAWFAVVTSLGIGATFYIALAFVFDRPFTREMLKAVVR